jgi:hypothetical protein
VQQLRSKVALEVLDQLRHRRPRDVQRVRRLRERACFGDADEDAQGEKLIHGSPLIAGQGGVAIIHLRELSCTNRDLFSSA